MQFHIIALVMAVQLVGMGQDAIGAAAWRLREAAFLRTRLGSRPCVPPKTHRIHSLVVVTPIANRKRCYYCSFNTNMFTCNRSDDLRRFEVNFLTDYIMCIQEKPVYKYNVPRFRWQVWNLYYWCKDLPLKKKLSDRTGLEPASVNQGSMCR